MNKLVESINNRASVREYLNKDIDEQTIKELLSCIQHLPNSINGQQVSVILVKDKIIKNKLAEISNNMFIATAPMVVVFLMDYYKTMLAGKKNNVNLIIQNDIESVFTGNVDAGILMGGLTIIAEDLGLGTCIVGGVRKEADKTIELLKLPKYTYPIAAMTIGYFEDKPMSKPRMNYESFVHENTYHSENMQEYIDEYDGRMEKYLEKINRKDIEGNWSKKVCSCYSNDESFQNIIGYLEKQNIKIK